MKTALVLIAILCLGGTLFFFLGYPYAPPKIKRLRYPTDQEALRGMHIVAAGDFHLRTSTPERYSIEHICAQINAEKPDMIVLLGDFIDGRGGTQVELENRLEKALKTLHAPYGVYAVMGNHEWYYNPARMMKVLQRSNVHFLRNNGGCVHGRNGDFNVIGFGEYMFNDAAVPETYERIENKDLPLIVLSHHPYNTLAMTFPCALCLCAHTHGGQAQIPFFHIPLFGDQVVRDFPGGDYTLPHGGKLHVTTGIGGSVVPLRLFVQPEILSIVFE